MSNLYFNTGRSVFLLDPTLSGIVWRISGGQRVFVEEGGILPSYGSPKEPTVTLDKVQFGDGYEQVALAGINPVQDTFNLNFNSKRRAVAIALERFFKGEPAGSIYERNPAEWFWWQPVYPYDRLNALPIKVRCEKWSLTPQTWDSVNVATTFIKSFEP